MWMFIFKIKKREKLLVNPKLVKGMSQRGYSETKNLPYFGLLIKFIQDESKYLQSSLRDISLYDSFLSLSEDTEDELYELYNGEKSKLFTV